MKIKFEKILIWSLLIISLISIYLIEFKFSDTPEKYEFGYEFGKVVSNLSLAYIASGIFYVLIVYLPNKRDKKNIYKHASSINDSIIMSGMSLFRGAKDKYQTIDFNTEIEEKSFYDYCNEIGPNDIQDFYITRELKYTIYYREHINKIRLNIKIESKNIFTYITHLDTENIDLINEILKCQLMTSLAPYFEDETYTKEITSFEQISPALYDFYKKIILLKKYNLRHKK